MKMHNITFCFSEINSILLTIFVFFSLQVLERPLQTSPSTITGHVSITGTNHHFGNEINGITSLNTSSPTAALLANGTNTQFVNQLPLDYYTDQYISSSAVNQWPVAHNTNDTLFMQLGKQQLKLLSNTHLQSPQLHPQSSAALLINSHHQLQTAASLYSNSPGLITPSLNSPNFELANLNRQSIYQTLNKLSNLGDEFHNELSLPQSNSMLLSTHQIQPQTKLNPNMLNELEQ